MKCKNAYRDADKYNRYRNAYNARYYAKTADAPNKNMRWSEEENRLVCEHLMTDTELSVRIGRSVKAIQMHRTKLKRTGQLEEYLSQDE